jgi:hypothetical protein
MHLKDELAVKYAHLIYNGFWFSPEREMLQAAIDHSQAKVTGTVRVKLYKGNATVIGRESNESLYDQELVTFEDGAVAYDQKDAAGFIKLNALRLRVLARQTLETRPPRAFAGSPHPVGGRKGSPDVFRTPPCLSGPPSPPSPFWRSQPPSSPRPHRRQTLWPLPPRRKPPLRRGPKPSRRPCWPCRTRCRPP